MARVEFRFDPALDLFLPHERRGAPFTRRLEGTPSVKDALEACGVPHTEVEALSVGGRPVDFGYLLRDGDVVTVAAEQPPAGEARLALRPPLQREPGFVLDTHLGKLATYLRMLGFDTLYRNDYRDDELAQVASRDGRVLLSRDVGVLKRALVIHGRYLRATHPRAQLVELLRHYGLWDAIGPFRRCLRCNGLLAPLAKAEAAARLPAGISAPFDEFRRCPACERIYWPGSHYERMARFVAAVRAEREAG